MNPELSSSFCHACSNLKRACCVEWALRNPQSSSFKKIIHINKYKADHTLLFRIPLREEARYLLPYSYIHQSDLSSCGQALYLTVLENVGIYQMK